MPKIDPILLKKPIITPYSGESYRAAAKRMWAQRFKASQALKTALGIGPTQKGQMSIEVSLQSARLKEAKRGVRRNSGGDRPLGNDAKQAALKVRKAKQDMKSTQQQQRDKEKQLHLLVDYLYKNGIGVMAHQLTLIEDR